MHDDSFGCTRYDRNSMHISARHARSAQRVDEQVDLELVFHESLHARPGAAETAVAAADLDHITGTEVTVHDVDQ